MGYSKAFIMFYNQSRNIRTLLTLRGLPRVSSIIIFFRASKIVAIMFPLAALRSLFKVTNSSFIIVNSDSRLLWIAMMLIMRSKLIRMIAINPNNFHFWFPTSHDNKRAMSSLLKFKINFAENCLDFCAISNVGRVSSSQFNHNFVGENKNVLVHKNTLI